jgi:hypothetical protein
MKLKVLKKRAFIGLFHPVSEELPKLAEKASLLTASGMLLHAFPSMFVSSLDEFPENCVFFKNIVTKLLYCPVSTVTSAYLFYYNHD